ncbi:MAG: immunoglobulin-like domain-containing protein [Candidatus Saccharibacteria bacterium]
MKLFSKSNKLIVIATFLILAVQAIVNVNSVMAIPTPGSTSQNNGSIFYDDGSVGAKTWTISVGNALPAYFTSQPSTAPNTSQQSHYLLALGFNSNVPNDATITGIAVKVERKTDAMSIKDADIHLIKNWAILASTNPTVAPNTGLTTCPTSIDGDCWVTNETTVTYGGASDLWGSTWTPADVNSPNFGLAFSAQRMYGSNSLTPGDDGSSSKKIYIDNVNITVYYTTEQEATTPIIASHPDVNAIATNASGINVTYTAPNAIDGDETTLADCSPISGSLFPIGTTTVTCTKTNTAGNSATPTHFNVIVSDGTIPTISLNGDSPKIITVGDSYVDAGATATDGYDGNITEPIAIISNVNTSTVGNYTVTYNVSDAAGNAAVTVTRTVIVAPRKITVIADNQTKVAGTIDPTLTYSITSGSLIGNDGFTGAITRVTGETTGIYAINRGNLELNGNYTLSFTDGLFEITPAPIVTTTTNTTPTTSNISYTPTSTPEITPDTTSEAPVATAILGTQTDNDTAKTTTDKNTEHKSTNIFGLTFLGVHDWLWFVLIAIAGAAFWWIIVGRRRKDDDNEQN